MQDLVAGDSVVFSGVFEWEIFRDSLEEEGASGESGGVGELKRRQRTEIEAFDKEIFRQICWRLCCRTAHCPSDGAIGRDGAVEGCHSENCIGGIANYAAVLGTIDTILTPNKLGRDEVLEEEKCDERSEGATKF